MITPGASIPTRQSLLLHLKDWNDQKSWQDFFDLYWKLIYGVAIQAGLSDAEAQDVVQETIISVSKKIGEFKPDPALGSFKSWLLLITRRRIVDQFRKRPHLNVLHQAASDDTSTTSTVAKVPDPASLNLEAVWDAQWKNNLLEVAMERVKEKVSPKQYLIFHQLVMKEWPAQKVAEKLSVNLAQIYMAKYRISQMVKKEVRILEKSVT